MESIRGFGRSPGNVLLAIALLLVVGAALCGGPSAIAEIERHNAEPVVPAGDARAGREAFIRLGCHQCHRVTHDPELDPPLDHPDAESGPVLGYADPESLIMAIVSGAHLPSVDQPRQSRWPPSMGDLGTKMTLADLINLVEYLGNRQRDHKVSGGPDQ